MCVKDVAKEWLEYVEGCQGKENKDINGKERVGRKMKEGCSRGIEGCRRRQKYQFNT